MPLLTNIERRALARGAKENCQQNIIKILQNRFDNIPELMVKTINQIDDISLLENLLLPSISVNSLEEFQQLISSNLTNRN